MCLFTWERASDAARTDMPTTSSTSLGQVALVCAQLHDGARPLQAALEALAKYEPPACWNDLDPVFGTAGERSTWITNLVTRIWLAYSEIVRNNPAGFPPALYRPYSFHSSPSTAPFPWEKANPVSHEEMLVAMTKIINEDRVLRTIYKPRPELLLRKWWDELNGWCREYRSAQQERWWQSPHTTGDDDDPQHREVARLAAGLSSHEYSTAFSSGCPCPKCTTTSVSEMLDRMASASGFSYSLRVAHELDNLFPQSAKPRHRLYL